MELYYHCTNCKETKPRSEMTTARPSTMKGRCKKCHSNDMANRLMRKKAELSPQNYKMCNDCDGIFSKFISGSQSFYFKAARKETEVCTRCGSENIEDY